ncbi:hypothetical protein [Clostridium novyi]|uniref:hypothetical protein n=1 Tax=Clostridium novyi TaxID=1542 RepID=UPI0006916A6F|nr:hypothetical protein [Clostridium novyi]
MNRNKIKKLFALAVISGALMTGIKSEAYAVVTDYAIKVNDQVYSYNQNDLTNSFLDYKINKPAKLYEDFKTKLKDGNGFYAFKDDKKGFIPYETLEKGLLQAKNDKKAFNVDKVIEMDDCKAIEVSSVKEIKVNEKDEISEVLIKKEDENKDNKNDDNKVKNEETVTSKSTTSSSKSSGGSSSRRSSSSERRVETKKEQAVNPKQKKEEVQKKPEVEKNKEEKKAEQAVNPEQKKEEVEKKLEVEKDKEEKTNSMIPKITEGKRCAVEKNEKPASITSGKSIKLKSEITQVAQKSYPLINQETTVFIRGVVENDGKIEVAGQNIEVKKGDKYSVVADKIKEHFKNNEDWQVEHKYVQAGYQSNLTFKAKKVRDHVDNLFVSGNGIEFFNIKNEAYGFKGIMENREVCTATVLEDCKKNETINIKVSSDIVNKTFAILKVEVKSGESKNTLAERIATQLKANEEIKRYFTIQNNKDKIVLTQKNIADKLDLKVTIENEEKSQSEDNREKSHESVSAPVNKEAENLKGKQVEEEQKKQQEGQIKQIQPEKQQDEKEKIKNQENTLLLEVESIKEGSVVQPSINQEGYLAFKFKGEKQDKLNKEQEIKVLDKTIKLEKGDDSSKIKTKILEAFKDHKEWNFDIGYVVVEGNGASVKYDCKRAQENVDKFAEDTDEIKFIQDNRISGDPGKEEVKEQFQIVVKKPSSEKTTINITLKLKGTSSVLGQVKVEIEAKETVEQVAKNIAKALKGNNNISRLYTIEVKQANIVLTQNKASGNQTEVIIK